MPFGAFILIVVTMEMYGIKAENRITNERVFITQPMTLVEALAWEATYQLKKRYKYFRVARYRGKYESN